MKKPIVKLIDFTREPLKIVWLARKIMEQEVPESLEEIKVSEKELEENFRRVINELQSPLEFINTVWIFKNVSRQFTHQLVRKRTASYAQQSLRVVPKERFYEDYDFYVPPEIEKDSRKLEFLKKAMHNIQELYREALSLGFKVEDARIILPIGIYTSIMMCINYRNLLNFLYQRLCHVAQAEIRTVALMMREEIRSKIGEIFAEPIKEPCLALGRCLFPYTPCEFRKMAFREV
jgi:thymidylate synthase (FAD)